MTFGERIVARILGCGLGDANLMLGLYRRGQLRDQAGRWRQATMIPRKPFESVRSATGFVRRHGTTIRALHGVGSLRQWTTLAWASLRHSAEVDAFTAYWAFAVRRPARWNCWIGDRHAFVLFGDLAERCAPDLRRTLRDKRTFAEWGAARGLPTVATLAWVVGGEPSGSTLEQVAAGLPDADLFAKPTNLSCGKGTRRWLRVAPGLWHDESGAAVDAAAIVSAVAAASRTDPMLLQRCLRPHPCMLPLAPWAVSTVRCVTIRGEAGEPRLLRTSLRLPVAGMIVDNVSGGGMFAALDLETGRIGRVIRRREDGLLEQTCVPGGPGADTALADLWPAITRLALDAQRAAGPMPMIGWDIGLTFEGPVILEANMRWGGHLMTLPHEVPLGESELVTCFLRHWTGRTAGTARRHGRLQAIRARTGGR